MKAINKAFASLLLLSACTVHAQNTTVKIQGILDTEEPKTEITYDGAESLMGASKNIPIQADKNKRFSVEFKLDKPAFYKIRRNTLYLTPGDNLEIVIREDADKAEFKGKGAEANMYMKDRLFSKAGSYLAAGRGVYSTLDSTVMNIRQQAKERMDQLSKLKNVTQEFKDLETARIKADIINSYLAYPGYAGKSKDVINSYIPEINQLAKEINQARYLDVEVVRDVFFKYLLNKPELLTGITLDNRIQEINETKKQIRVLSINPTKENIEEIKAYIKTMKSEDLKNELSTRVKQIGHLVKESPAFDIQLEDVNGKIARLSDFKGKYIYVDLWATWCGPCKAEAPYFEKMQKELNSDEIAFISISVDTSKDAWKKYLQAHQKETKQFISDDRSIKQNWLLNGIPRFILIDKDFKIIDAFAKRPSEAVTKVILMNLIKK